MVEEDIEALKKEFIVDSGTFEQEKIPELVKRIMPFCKIEKSGRVYFESKDLSYREKIVFVMAARFLASRLDSTIQSEVTAEELSEYLGLAIPQTGARLSEAMEGGYLARVSRGRYTLVPGRLEKFLDAIEHVKP